MEIFYSPATPEPIAKERMWSNQKYFKPPTIPSPHLANSTDWRVHGVQMTPLRKRTRGRSPQTMELIRSEAACQMLFCGRGQEVERSLFRRRFFYPSRHG